MSRSFDILNFSLAFDPLPDGSVTTLFASIAVPCFLLVFYLVTRLTTVSTAAQQIFAVRARVLTSSAVYDSWNLDRGRRVLVRWFPFHLLTNVFFHGLCRGDQSYEAQILNLCLDFSRGWMEVQSLIAAAMVVLQDGCTTSRFFLMFYISNVNN